MPPVATNAAPSTVAVVLGQARDALRATGNPIDFMVGAKYAKEFGAGKPPRILVIADRDGGEIGPPMEMGYAASMTHSCEVYVRAAETGDDLTRLDAAYRLADLVVDYVGTAATGKLAWGKGNEDSPLDVDAYGADYGFRFTYQRDIRHDPARRRLAGATSDTSAAHSPVSPQAVAADEPITIAVTTAAQEPG